MISIQCDKNYGKCKPTRLWITKCVGRREGDKEAFLENVTFNLRFKKGEGRSQGNRERVEIPAVQKLCKVKREQSIFRKLPVICRNLGLSEGRGGASWFS